MTPPTRQHLLSLLRRWRALEGNLPSLELLKATDDVLAPYPGNVQLPGQTDIYDFQEAAE